VGGQDRGHDDLESDQDDDRQGSLARERAEAEAGQEPDRDLELDPQADR
jgi:hypothetical protein